MSRVPRNVTLNLPQVGVQNPQVRTAGVPSVGIGSYDAGAEAAAALERSLGIASQITGQFADMNTRAINEANQQNYAMQRASDRIDAEEERRQAKLERAQRLEELAQAGAAKKDARLRAVFYAKQIESGELTIPDGSTPEEAALQIIDRDTKDMPASYVDAYEAALAPSLYRAIYSKQEADKAFAFKQLVGYLGESAEGEQDVNRIKELASAAAQAGGDRIPHDKLMAQVFGPALSTAARTGDLATIEAIDKGLDGSISDIVALRRNQAIEFQQRQEVERRKSISSRFDSMLADVRDGTDTYENVRNELKSAREQIGDDTLYNQLTERVNSDAREYDKQVRERADAEYRDISKQRAVLAILPGLVDGSMPLPTGKNGDLVLQLPSGKEDKIDRDELLETARAIRYQQIEQTLPPPQQLAAKAQFTQTSGVVNPEWQAVLQGSSALVSIGDKDVTVHPRAEAAYQTFAALSAVNDPVARKHMDSADYEYMTLVDRYVKDFGISAREAMIEVARNGRNKPRIITSDNDVAVLDINRADFVSNYASFLYSQGRLSRDAAIKAAKQEAEKRFVTINGVSINVLDKEYAKSIDLDSVGQWVVKQYATQMFGQDGPTGDYSISPNNTSDGSWVIVDKMGRSITSGGVFTDDDIKAIHNELTYADVNQRYIDGIENRSLSSRGSWRLLAMNALVGNQVDATREAVRLSNPASTVPSAPLPASETDIDGVGEDARRVIQYIRADREMKQRQRIDRNARGGGTRQPDSPFHTGVKP